MRASFAYWVSRGGLAGGLEGRLESAGEEKGPISLTNAVSCHFYHQLFVQAQFAKSHLQPQQQYQSVYACIGYKRAEQLTQRVFIDGLLAPNTCYGFVSLASR